MKPVDPEDRSTGIDLASARESLKGLQARRLDSDWLAVDGEGHVAFFAGNDHGPIPDTSDMARVGEALDALARAASRGRPGRPRANRAARRLVREARHIVRGRGGDSTARVAALPSVAHQRDETMAFAISAKPAPRFDGAIHRGGTLSTRA